MKFIVTICIISLALPCHAKAKKRKKPIPKPTPQVSIPAESDLKSIEDIRRFRDELDLRSEILAPTGQSPMATVGQDIKKFSEEVATRVDRIVKRNSFRWLGDPWTIQGLPLILPSGSSGFHLGLRAMVHNLGRQDPHKLELENQILASDKGRYKHFTQIDYPHAWGSNYRVTTRLSYDRDIGFRYYGAGNATVSDPTLASNGTYNFVRAGPTLSLRLLRYLDRYYRVGPVFGLKWLNISAPPGSLLATNNPVGINGGRSHFLGIAMVRDSTDFEPYPSRGTYSELQFNVYSQLVGSDYPFFRATYQFRHYITLHPELIFGQRLFFESITGDAPFYELQGVGGSDPTIGFGGDKYFRGFDSNRFVDHIRLVYGAELRWDPLTFDFAKQELTIGIVPFVDVGRVWGSVFPLELLPIHASTGWGLRLIWNSRLIIRADVALNSEGVNAYMELGHSF